MCSVSKLRWPAVQYGGVEMGTKYPFQHKCTHYSSKILNTKLIHRSTWKLQREHIGLICIYYDFSVPTSTKRLNIIPGTGLCLYRSQFLRLTRVRILVLRRACREIPQSCKKNTSVSGPKMQGGDSFVKRSVLTAHCKQGNISEFNMKYFPLFLR